MRDTSTPVEALNQALEHGAILPLPALHESYSVLTRLPSPLKLSAEQAFVMLSSLGGAQVVSLDGSFDDLRGRVDGGVVGGLVYDARILACAKKGGAKRLLTFNLRHFERLNAAEVSIEEPVAL